MTSFLLLPVHKVNTLLILLTADIVSKANRSNYGLSYLRRLMQTIIQVTNPYTTETP